VLIVVPAEIVGFDGLRCCVDPTLCLAAHGIGVG
jgi:hypothetical protein